MSCSFVARAQDPLAAQAAAARAAGRLDEAAQLYEQALRRQPRWQEGWWALGTTYYESGKYAEARRALLKLTTLAPQAGAAWQLLGLSEFELRAYDAALARLQRGRTSHSAAPAALQQAADYQLALLLNRAGEFEAAAEILKALTQDETSNDDLLCAWGLNALRRNQLPLELSTGEQPLCLLAGRAALAASRNRNREAQAAYEELKNRFPDASGAAYARGLFLLREAPDEALEEFRRELQRSPQHVEARLQIALELLKRQQAEAGLPYAEAAVARAPRLAAAHYTLGRLLLLSAQTARAVMALRTAARLAPRSPEIWFALAQAYERAGRKAEAAQARANFVRLKK